MYYLCSYISLNAWEHVFKSAEVMWPYMLNPSADHQGNYTVREEKTTFQTHKGRYSPDDSGQEIVPAMTFSLDLHTVKRKDG